MTDSHQFHSVMSGKGYYNRHSKTQAAALRFALPYLEAAAREVKLPENGEEFHVADFGSSTGGNSLVPLRLLFDILRERQSFPFPITVTHTDQAGNDFTALFLMLQNDPDSYLRGSGEVYPYAIGSSFYQRLFPEREIDLAWSSIALHWMSRVPAPLTDHIWSSFATGAAHQAFADQARTDWETFLRCRAKELKPGAALILVAGACDDAGRTGGEPFLDLANQALQAMVAAGRLERTEYERFTIPVYSRTLREFRAPFDQLPFSEWYRLEASRIDFSPDAQCRQFQEDGDLEAFAANLTAFFQAFTESLFRGALDPQRPPEAAQSLVDGYYRDVRRAVFAAGRKLDFGWNVVSLQLRRN